MVYPTLEFGREIWPCFYKRITEVDETGGKKVEVVMEMVSVDHILQEPIFEVMQFTGLTDRNGKEIYEGDVVESQNIRNVYVNLQNEYNLFSKPEPFIGVVEWFNEYSCYAIRYAGRLGIFHFSNIDIIDGIENTTTVQLIQEDDLTIIGNIYQTPNLLKP
jgi:uncharacterized phage protein (TIGR01671 family)